MEILKNNVMILYGTIQNGYLSTREIAPIITQKQNPDGTFEEITVSEEDQIAELPEGWKPVDAIDETQTQASDPENFVRIEPYDAGARISFHYITVIDKQRIRAKIQELKDYLTDSDYKITKCYEASMTSRALPYDLEPLLTQRQEARDKINELEAKLESV